MTSPARTAPWMAAPTATTSSGLTPLCGSRPKISLATASMAGMRVMPPTRTTSSTLNVAPLRLRASSRHRRHGPRLRSTSSCVSSSNFARVIFICRCFGPLASAVMNGRLMSVSMTVESSHLAFSAASLSRCRAIWSFRRSMPVSRWNLSAM